jgi:hypothetical protein
MAQKDVLDEWDAAVEKARAALVRAIERKDTAEHPEAVEHYEAAWEEVNRLARDALLGERKT